MASLYIVATPIGNLEDITLRALRVLKEVDVIFAEDTRVTRKLLSHFDIHVPTQSLNARTEAENASKVIDSLSEDKNVAYVTDAGTPGISDPGNLLVSRVRGAGFQTIVIPGPSALAAAISIAGVPASHFLFLGFLPHKKGRETMFKEIAATERPVVFYESPHRIIKALNSLIEHCPGRRIVIARELTKIHEEVIDGTPAEVLSVLEETPEKQKGEFVVIVEPKN